MLRESLHSNHDDSAVAEYHEIYDRHTFSDPTPFTTPPIPPWEF